MPGVSLGTRKRDTPSSAFCPPAGGFCPEDVRAATTITSAVWASWTKSLVPSNVKPAPLAAAWSVMPRAPSSAEGSIQASVARASPEEIFGSHAFFWASVPASRMARPPSSTVEKNGPGTTERPISSISTTRSTKPSPMPPCSSAKMSPVHPCSAIFFQRSGVMPSGPSMSLRTVSDAHSLSKNFRAVLRSSSCSSLNPKFMV